MIDDVWMIATVTGGPGDTFQLFNGAGAISELFDLSGLNADEMLRATTLDTNNIAVSEGVMLRLTGASRATGLLFAQGHKLAAS